MKIVNPATELTIQEVNEHSPLEIRVVFDELSTAQPRWAEKTVEERLSIILEFANLVKQEEDELASILTSETGKPIQQSLNEIRGAFGRFEHLKSNAHQWLKSEVMSEGDTREEIEYEPLGVIGNISAWNFPYNVGYNVFLYALVAGNAVMYKPSEYATLTGLKMETLLHRAGVPTDIFRCITGGAEAGSLMLELDLDGYFFTGSYGTGKFIIEQVAGKMVPVQLELGGKDPLYVCDDVLDVKQSAVNAAEGAFYNNGQSCCAVERIYVHSEIFEDFVREFVAEVSSYKMGDPAQADTFIGPLTRKAQLEILSAQVEDAVSRGASVLSGGKSVHGKGYYFEPTVITEVNHEMRLMREESFGPIIGIQKVTDDNEAIGLMKDTEYGLTAAVFSANELRAKAILSQLNVGTAYWNCCDRVSPNVPWSGRGNSGLGSTLSHRGIRAFVQPKAWHLRG